ncbi:RNA polymerase beta-subunit [Treponema primitia ZAS-2]|uniref:RNA polymerase beta-subunit n=1 Tax=Treponema primitia (strain ATCC BAA-887 / DSM 12427 / ZAS-2) TaxID=545694 RepID=F5YI96_TREPZ|nr:hypothetical protein [Treponema primitia]AEF83527.1 RNA polymerase beta-subunit [Treponema primitia ZAS-2]
MNDSVYKSHGYEGRDEYLENLADDYGVDSMIINAIAEMLGPDEDFDGLLSDLEDFEYFGLLDDFRKKGEAVNGN